MDEDVIKDLYARAQGLGYGKSIEEFTALLHTDDEVLQDNFSYVQEQGYPKGLEDFSVLVGRKKKEPSESVDIQQPTSVAEEVGISASVDDPGERLRGLRMGVSRLNEDGSRSTVKMADMEVDGKFVAIPTLYPKDPNNFGPDAEDWVEFGEDDAMGAYDMALQRGEVFEFDTPEEAGQFAQGSWKSLEEEAPKDTFERKLDFVDNRLIDRLEAGQTARELEYEFGDYGFTFDRGFSVGIGNYITVTANNGETIDINTNPQFLTDEDEQTQMLKDFLIENRGTTEKLKLQESIGARGKEMEEANTAHERAQAAYNAAAAQLERYAEEVELDPERYSEAEHRQLVERVNEAAQADEEAVNEYNALLAMQQADVDAYEAETREKGEELTALERAFGKNAVTDFIADNTYRAVMQGQAQAGTIRSSYNLTVNANDVTDEDIQDFLRAQAVLEQNGPSDEMRDFQRRYKDEGGGWGGFVKTLFSADAPPLMELFVSSVSMMVNKEVLAGAAAGAAGGAAVGATGFSLGPLGTFTTAGGAISGAMGGAGASLEAGISFAEFLREEMAEKQGVDPDKVVMNNEKIREVLSDEEAMARINRRQAGRGIAIGVTSMIGTALAANVTRRVAVNTGKKLKAAGAGALAEMPFEALGEASGRLVAAQEMDAAEIGLEALAGGPAQVAGVAMGLFKVPQYTLNGELVTGEQMAAFIRDADEADVAGATIEIKNDDVLAKEAHTKRDDARERVVIKEQLRKSGVENDEQVDRLADLELEKRKLKGLETTAANRKRERIQREIDAILDGDSYFFEETVDEEGNKVSKEVRVTRRDALLALAEDDILNPTEKEIEAKRAELFRDALADIQETDAVQEQSTEEVSPRDETEAGPEVGGEVQDEQESTVEEKEDVGPEIDPYDARSISRIKMTPEQVREADALENERTRLLSELNKAEEATGFRAKAKLKKARQAFLDASTEVDNFYSQFGKATQNESALLKRIQEIKAEERRLMEERRLAGKPGIFGIPSNEEYEASMRSLQSERASLFEEIRSGRAAQSEQSVQEASPDVDESTSPTDEIVTDDVTETEVVDKPTELTDDVSEEAEELAAAFKAESTPDVEEDIDGVRVRRREGYEFDRKAQRILDQAKKRVKSLSNFGVNIVLHENDAQYEAVTGQRGRGVYDNKTIHINLARANSRTVAHEAFHALFLERVKGDDAKAQQWAKATMKSIRKALDADSVLATRIDDFLTRYEEDIVDEEALAEIFGYLSEGYGELTAPQQSSVKAAIKKLFELFGVKLEAQWSQDDQNVIDVFNMLAGKMERGEEITQAELAGIDVSEEKAEEARVETETDTRIAELQKKRAKAQQDAATETRLAELDDAIGRTGDSAAQRVYNKLFKSVGTGQLRAIEKQMRDTNKSKKMSEADKVERLDKLGEKYNKELEKLAANRAKAAERVEQELKRLEPEVEKATKRERLAKIKEEQKEISAKLAKDKREAKKAFKDEELKEYIAGLAEEAEAKRAALRDEIAELRGEKKKVEEAPVEEVVEKTPVVEETPTVGTIRTKVGVEAFGKLEAAMRDYLEYMDTVNPDEVERTRGEKSTITRRQNKVDKLADELGLTDSERAVVLNSVREARREEQRAEANREAEAAERKAAAERAKKANTKANLELMLKSARTALEEAEAELARQEEEGAVLDSQIELVDAARAEVARLESELGTEAPVKKAAPKKKAPAKPVKKKAPAKKRVAKKPAPKEIVEEMFGPETEQERAAADARNKQRMLEMQAEVEGISVEELTKREAEKERQRKDTLSREAKRELDGLKGKTDKASKAKRAELKEFMSNLGTMSVDEAQSKRRKTPTAREQRVAANEFDLKSLKKIGEGSDRIVYDLGDGRVLKVAKTVKGLVQNSALQGGDKQMLGDLVPEVYFEDEGLDYVIMENVPRNDKAVRQWMKFMKRSFDNNGVTRFGGLAPETMQYLEAKGLGDFLNYNALWGDFFRPSSWGQRANGDFVLIDEGTLLSDSDRRSTPNEFFQQDWAEVKLLRRQPKAREQKASEVLGRYKFRPDGSLIGDSRLASELRGYMRKFGFGVEQFGERDDRFYIVEDGKRVKPEDVIASDEAFIADREAIEGEQREAQAAESLARAEAEERAQQELQQYQDEYQDFPESMVSAPSRLSPRQQRESLQDAAAGFDDASLVKFAKERGYSDKAILAIRPGAKDAIAAYDAQATRLSREVQGIIERTRARARGDKKIQAIENKGLRTKAINDRIIKDVKAYIRKSKMYEEASDVGREAMLRAVDKQMGRRVKAAPSVLKILDLTPDKGVLIDKKNLIEQIRAMARSSKATAAASREIMREVGKDIAKLKATGAITGAQATAILRKLTAMDPFNPVQVENFVNYAARVFAEAEHAQEVNRLNKLRKRAYKNAGKKLGIAQDLMPMLQTLLNIDAGLIPESVFEQYQKLVNDLGERKAVLDLDERDKVSEDVVNIMAGVSEELAKKEELFARYDSFQPKGDSVSATIDAMVEQELLSEDEVDVLKKYANELREKDTMTEEEKEAAREEERVRLMAAIRNLPNLKRAFPTQKENQLVDRFNKLMRTQGVDGLSNADLKNVLRVADNIQNGFLPHTAQVLVEQVEVNNRAVIVEQAVKEAKLPRIARVRALFDGITNDTAIARLVERNPLRFIDQVYGDYKSSRIYDAVFKDLASGYASYKADIMGVQQRLDKVEQKLINSLNRNPNRITRSKFLIGAYMMQAEFDANPTVPGVFDAVSLLDATIEKSNKSKGRAYYSAATADMLSDIRKKIDGKSAEEIREMLSNEERAVADEIRAVNDELTPKAEYVAGVLRGVPFRPFSQYFHRIVLKADDKQGLKGVDALIDQAKVRMRRPSTKAQNVQARQTTAPPAVNFDPFASAKRGARYILTDYHMTEAVRTNARLLNKLSDAEFTRKQRKFLNAIDDASETAVTDALVQSYTISTVMEKVFETIKRQGYRVVLADLPRMAAELTSNILMVMTAFQRQFLTGVGKYYKTMATNGGDVLKNVGSVQATRLYADSGTISSRMVETIRSASGPERNDAANAVSNRMKQIWAYTGASWGGAVGQLADTMITTPDKLATRPVWFGTFALEFKEQTGQEVDFDKIAANDEAYMAEHAEAIKAATDAADLASVQVGATDNPFLGIVNSMRKPDAKNLYRVVNSYMTRFLVFEFVTTRTAVNAMVGNGMISPMQGFKLMLGVTGRMISYVFLANILRDAVDKALEIDDEDDETMEEKLEDAALSSMLSLVLGGTFGAIPRGLAATGVEYYNRMLMEDAGLDFEYEDQILIPLMSPTTEGQAYKKEVNALIRASGPYNPILRTAELGARIGLEEPKKTREGIKRRDAEVYRLGLEVLGLMGMVPLYKDIRRVMVKQIYKDIDKEDTPESMGEKIRQRTEEMKKKRKRPK